MRSALGQGLDTNPDPSRAPALVCAALALVAGSLVAAYSVMGNGGSVSTLVRMVESDSIFKEAEERDPTFEVVPEGHYDGVYFYAIALDPLALEEPNYMIDAAVYRYGHPGYGWLAWLVTGGRAVAVPYALLALNLLAFPVAAYLAARLAAGMGKTPWAGLMVALNPGLLYAISVDTGEVVSAALLAGGLYAWFKGRIAIAGILFALLPFTREVLVAVPLGLAVWEIARNRSAPDLIVRVGTLVTTAIPLALWWGYLYGAFGMLPTEAYPGSFELPFIGWGESMMEMVTLSRRNLDANQLGTFALPFILSIALLLMIVIVRSMRMRSFLHPPVLLLALVCSTFGPIQVQYPKDLVRLLAVPLTLSAAVFTEVSAPVSPTSLRGKRRRRLLAVPRRGA